MNYASQIEAKKQEVIAELPPDYGQGFIIGKIYGECCNNAVGRSHWKAVRDMNAAHDEIIGMIGDYDLSITEWWKDEYSAIQYGNPALENLLVDLYRYRRITIGDFQIVIDAI